MLANNYELVSNRVFFSTGARSKKSKMGNMRSTPLKLESPKSSSWDEVYDPSVITVPDEPLNGILISEDGETLLPQEVLEAILLKCSVEDMLSIAQVGKNITLCDVYGAFRYY